jgi:uncharacterized protein with HEPN domain
MAPATVLDRLRHILTSIEIIEGYWRGLTFADYEADELRRAATERHVEIISEASRHIPDDDKAEHPQVPWRDISGVGNILRHRYETVTSARIWEIVTLDLPALKAVIEAIIAKHERGG